MKKIFKLFIIVTLFTSTSVFAKIQFINFVFPMSTTGIQQINVLGCGFVSLQSGMAQGISSNHCNRMRIKYTLENKAVNSTDGQIAFYRYLPIIRVCAGSANIAVKTDSAFKTVKAHLCSAVAYNPISDSKATFTFTR